jgi:hypothetical protein
MKCIHKKSLFEEKIGWKASTKNLSLEEKIGWKASTQKSLLRRENWMKGIHTKISP